MIGFFLRLFATEIVKAMVEKIVGAWAKAKHRVKRKT